MLYFLEDVINADELMVWCWGIQMQKLLAVRRFQMNTQGKTDIPAPQVAPPHPGYAPHAALHAIKRHAVELMNQKEQVTYFIMQFC